VNGLSVRSDEPPSGHACCAFPQRQTRPVDRLSEWDRQTENLKRLATAYATTFPLPDAATALRIDDKEAAKLAGGVAAQVDQIKRAADADKTLAKPAKEALKTELDAIVKQAKTLQSGLEDGKPATGEWRTLKEKIAALTTEGREVPPSLLTTIGGLRAPLAKLDPVFA
jgi:hypothetical protein